MTKACWTQGVKVLHSVGKVLMSNDPLLWGRGSRSACRGLRNTGCFTQGPPLLYFYIIGVFPARIDWGVLSQSDGNFCLRCCFTHGDKVWLRTFLHKRDLGLAFAESSRSRRPAFKMSRAAFRRDQNQLRCLVMSNAGSAVGRE